MLVGIVLTPVVLGAPGDPAPAFTLDLFTGKTLTLAQMKGTAVLLLFWAEW
jgi:peroxiredoxin